MMRNNPLGELMDQIDALYDYVEDFVRDTGKTYALTLNEVFIDICRLIHGNVPNFKMPTFVENELTPMDMNKYGQGTNKRLLLFSGGKCSIAAALLYKRTGFEPILLYIRNTNPRYARESHKKYLNAIEVSKKLGMKFKSLPMDLDTHNPLCMMRMVNVAVEYIIDNHMPHTVSIGLFESSSVKNNPFELYGSTREFTRFQEDLYRCTLTDFKLSFPLPSYSIVWDEFMRRKEFIPYIDCEDEVDKAVLYITKVDFGVEKDAVSSIYMRNLKRLQTLYEREILRKAKLKKVWKRYFFYNIEQSKFYDQIKELL